MIRALKLGGKGIANTVMSHWDTYSTGGTHSACATQNKAHATMTSVSANVLQVGGKRTCSTAGRQAGMALKAGM